VDGEEELYREVFKKVAVSDPKGCNGLGLDWIGLDWIEIVYLCVCMALQLDHE